MAISLTAFDVGPAYATIKRPHLKTPKALKNAKDKVKKGAEEAGGKIEKAVKKALDKVIEAGNKALEPLGFSITEIQNIFKQLKPTMKLMKDLKADPTNPKKIKALRDSEGKKLTEEFVDGHCNSPQVIIASALPYVGNGVTTACSQLTSVVAKIEKVLAMSEKADTLIQDSKKGKASKKSKAPENDDDGAEDE